MSNEFDNQPPISQWKFTEQLKSPLHESISWRRAERQRGEANLAGGVSLQFLFPDDDGKLETAYDDFRCFLAAGHIDSGCGFQIATRQAETSCFEEYSITVEPGRCVVEANDTEGIRRGLVHVEDRILATGGPFLPVGKIRRTPFIKTRISRCFFGPIKRPPLNRDELLDDIDYYPEEYLNRLTHEGINGLWLSIEFRDFPSRFFPRHGQDAARRIDKLRRTAAKCARYGIKLYLFCNEPMGFGYDSYTLPMQELEANPSFKGMESGGVTYFCTSSEEGRQYIEECTHYLFSNVPDLGGLICIASGEGPTNCYSDHWNFAGNNCPRCSQREPWQVYREMAEAFLRGIKGASPSAEFICWLYTPIVNDSRQLSKERKFEIYRQIAAHMPKDVILQMNFESNGVVKQLGRQQTAYDYWLAWPGPSDVFRDCAQSAIAGAGARSSAKIQVGCSHENAAIPFMPVPGSLYRKYRAMKELGVSAVMQCWYFGNYPGLMNKAAGELSFLPFHRSEANFLQALARVNWPGRQQEVARAWRCFMKGYSNFPVKLSFTWYGPLHCSIVWPLHLIPVDRPIAPSWCFGYEDSGDRIGECIGFSHTLSEILVLLTRMDRYWQKGLEIMRSAATDFEHSAERQADVGLCSAIGYQIRSALNVFTFYELREKLPHMPKPRQTAALGKMEAIARDEMKNCSRMKALCLADPRLGFHSEAEGYKFFPEKLDWRCRLLEEMLLLEFPIVTESIANGQPLFPGYTGRQPEGKTYRCAESETNAVHEPFCDGSCTWKAWHTADNVSLSVFLPEEMHAGDSVCLVVEPRRLWPAIRFTVSSDGSSSAEDPTYGSVPGGWSAAIRTGGAGTTVLFTLPFAVIPWHDGKSPLRINLIRTASSGAPSSWVGLHPLKPSLMFGDHNSADLGWLLFMKNDALCFPG